jgi:hypothetical protein
VGTDWVRLFNKRLCDEIVSLDSARLEDFVQTHLGNLGKHSTFRSGLAEDIPASELLYQLRRDGRTEGNFKFGLVLDLCVFGERLYLDYWCCHAEVFSSDPPGSIPDTTLFPHMNAEDTYFRLLRPEHLDQMLASLDVHRADVTVMKQSDILLLRSWRDRCSTDSDTMVAYFFDY